MTDPSHKTLRSFYCRDYLWDLYEVIARDLGCSVDYLFNEALRHYARSCNYSIAVPAEGEAPVLMQGSLPASSTPTPHRPPPPLPQSASQPRVQLAPRPSGSLPRVQVPSQPRVQVPSQPRVPLAPRPSGSLPRVPQARAFQTQPTLSTAQQFQQQAILQNLQQNPVLTYTNPQRAIEVAATVAPMRAVPPGIRPPLFFDLNGQRVCIDQDTFVIGRGQDVDFTIRDSNISRRHCAIVWRDGAHYIQDMGSTNGVEYAGVRVAEHCISEGDIYDLCNYHLRFTYAG